MYAVVLTLPSMRMRKLQSGSDLPAEVEPGDELSLPVGVRHSSDEEVVDGEEDAAILTKVSCQRV